MGLQLWYSKIFGTRRKGSSFQEVRDLLNHITVISIAEDLACCNENDNIVDVKQFMSAKGFDVLGVVNHKKEIIGYFQSDDKEQNISQIKTSEITPDIEVSGDISILDLLEQFQEKAFLFVKSNENNYGIVTRADLDKPVTRIIIFSIISLFELHLTYWIIQHCPDNSWRDKLPEKRNNVTDEMFALKKERNEELELVECLQLCDKKTILNLTPEFKSKFNFSSKKFLWLMEYTEEIRNNIAHSQFKPVSNIDGQKTSSLILMIKQFLEYSETELINSEE